MTRRALSLLVMTLLASSCVSFGYTSRWIQEPIDPVRLDSLRPGQDNLGSCLARLGAPNFVWEYEGDGAALGWVYSNSGSWRVRVSFGFGARRNVSFSMTSTDIDHPGAVLWFDRDLQLLEWQEGLLAELVGKQPRRPAPVDDLDR